MGYLDNTGLAYLWSKLKTLLDGKLDKSGGTVTGNLNVTEHITAGNVQINSAGVLLFEAMASQISEDPDTGVLTIFPPVSCEVNFEGSTLRNVSPPTEATDAATKQYVDNAVGSADGCIFTVWWDKTTYAEARTAHLAGKALIIRSTSNAVGVCVQGPKSETDTAEFHFLIKPADTGVDYYVLRSDDTYAYYRKYYVPKTGGVMTGALTLPGDPTANLHATTKQYVDARRPRSFFVNIPASGWSRITETGPSGSVKLWQQTVSANGVTADNAVTLSPRSGSWKAAGEAGVYGHQQATNSLTFRALAQPGEDLFYDVLVQEVQ